MYFITTKRMLEVCFSTHPNIQYRTETLSWMRETQKDSGSEKAGEKREIFDDFFDGIKELHRHKSYVKLSILIQENMRKMESCQ